MIDRMFQIVVEAVEEDDGSLSWQWDAFGEEKRLCGGAAKTLPECIDSMRDYLRQEGFPSYVPFTTSASRARRYSVYECNLGQYGSLSSTDSQVYYDVSRTAGTSLLAATAVAANLKETDRKVVYDGPLGALLPEDHPEFIPWEEAEKMGAKVNPGTTDPHRDVIELVVFFGCAVGFVLWLLGILR